MSGPLKAWDGDLVRRWLESRFAVAKLDQAAADKRGYEAQDEYDKAAAEEWVCRVLRTGGRTGDQAALAVQIKELLAQDEYGITGIHDDRRFDRYVRTNLRKLAKMTKANDGFANTLRYQGWYAGAWAAREFRKSSKGWHASIRNMALIRTCLTRTPLRHP